MKINSGINSKALFATFLLVFGILSVASYFENGDEYTNEYIRKSEKIKSVVGEVKNLILTGIVSSKDVSNNLYYKEYSYVVSGSIAEAKIAIVLYFKESHKRENSDIVRVDIKNMMVIN